MSIYETNKNAIKYEAGQSLSKLYSPYETAEEIVKIKAFVVMAENEDMVKDALIACEDSGVIRRFEGDDFSLLRDEVVQILFNRREWKPNRTCSSCGK